MSASPYDCTFNEDDCLDCPEVEAIAYKPGFISVQPIIGWNAGANSADELDGDLHVKFDMVLGTSGAVVGLKQGRANNIVPNLVTHGFYFISAGGHDLVQIIESGVTKTTGVARAHDDTFEVRRLSGNVFYLINDVIVYRSASHSSGAVVVNACMYASGDVISSAGVVPDGGGDTPPPDPTVYGPGYAADLVSGVPLGPFTCYANTDWPDITQDSQFVVRDVPEGAKLTIRLTGNLADAVTNFVWVYLHHDTPMTDGGSPDFDGLTFDSPSNSDQDKINSPVDWTIVVNSTAAAGDWYVQIDQNPATVGLVLTATVEI